MLNEMSWHEEQPVSAQANWSTKTGCGCWSKQDKRDAVHYHKCKAMQLPVIICTKFWRFHQFEMNDVFYFSMRKNSVMQPWKRLPQSLAIVWGAADPKQWLTWIQHLFFMIPIPPSPTPDHTVLPVPSHRCLSSTCNSIPHASAMAFFIVFL